MISEKDECIFVHIPKTGGQSVESAFLKSHGVGWEMREMLLLRLNPDPAKGPERLAHLKAREYVSCGYISDADFERYYKFSFVRNPWDRLVSEYRYRKLEPRRSFRKFVIESFRLTEEYRDTSRHIRPQIEFVADVDGNYMVDFIGRFETLREDFLHVVRELGLRELDLTHRNPSVESRFERFRRVVTRRKGYQDYYSADLRDRVHEFYFDDVERFGYRFDGSFTSEPIIGNRPSGSQSGE